MPTANEKAEQSSENVGRYYSKNAFILYDRRSRNVWFAKITKR